MRRLLFCLAASAALSGYCLTPGTEPQDTTPLAGSGSTVLYPLPPVNPIGGKRVPSRRKISCEYHAPDLTLNTVFDEGPALLVLTDVESGEETKIPLESCSTTVRVGYLRRFGIRLSTSAGNIYGGWIEL